MLYQTANTIEAARANCQIARCRYETTTGAARARAWDDMMFYQSKAATLRAVTMEHALVAIAYDRSIEGAWHQTLARETLKQVRA